jgi:hypothetical protein
MPKSPAPSQAAVTRLNTQFSRRLGAAFRVVLGKFDGDAVFNLEAVAEQAVIPVPGKYLGHSESSATEFLEQHDDLPAVWAAWRKHCEAEFIRTIEHRVVVWKRWVREEVELAERKALRDCTAENLRVALQRKGEGDYPVAAIEAALRRMERDILINWKDGLYNADLRGGAYGGGRPQEMDDPIKTTAYVDKATHDFYVKLSGNKKFSRGLRRARKLLEPRLEAILAEQRALDEAAKAKKK